MRYLKKTLELGFKLVILFDLNVFAIQSNFVAKSVVFAFYSLVIGLFLKLLNMV